MTDDTAFCSRCKDEMLIRDGDEPTEICDHCAHGLVDELRAEIERLQAPKP